MIPICTHVVSPTVLYQSKIPITKHQLSEKNLLWSDRGVTLASIHSRVNPTSRSCSRSQPVSNQLLNGETSTLQFLQCNSSLPQFLGCEMVWSRLPQLPKFKFRFSKLLNGHPLLNQLFKGHSCDSWSVNPPWKNGADLSPASLECTSSSLTKLIRMVRPPWAMVLNCQPSSWKSWNVNPPSKSCWASKPASLKSAKASPAACKCWTIRPPSTRFTRSWSVNPFGRNSSRVAVPENVVGCDASAPQLLEL